MIYRQGDVLIRRTSHTITSAAVQDRVLAEHLLHFLNSRGPDGCVAARELAPISRPGARSLRERRRLSRAVTAR